MKDMPIGLLSLRGAFCADCDDDQAHVRATCADRVNMVCTLICLAAAIAAVTQQWRSHSLAAVATSPTHQDPFTRFVHLRPLLQTGGTVCMRGHGRGLLIAQADCSHKQSL